MIFSSFLCVIIIQMQYLEYDVDERKFIRKVELCIIFLVDFKMCYKAQNTMYRQTGNHKTNNKNSMITSDNHTFNT